MAGNVKNPQNCTPGTLIDSIVTIPQETDTKHFDTKKFLKNLKKLWHQKKFKKKDFDTKKKLALKKIGKNRNFFCFF